MTEFHLLDIALTRLYKSMDPAERADEEQRRRDDMEEADRKDHERREK